MLLVRNCFRQILQWSKRACVDVSMSIMVCQSFEGANVDGHEYRVEICTDGEASFRAHDVTLLHREQRSLLYAYRHFTYNRVTRRSCTTLP